MVFVAWFRLGFGYFYVVCAVVLANSFLAGAVCINSFHNAGEGLAAPKVRFCRGLLIGALWSANTTVSLIGINTEVLNYYGGIVSLSYQRWFVIQDH